MDITTLLGSADFFSAIDVKEKPKTVYIDSVREELFDNNGRKEAKAVVSFRGETKELACNKTNLQTIADVLGLDTKKWFGCKLTMFQDTTDYNGKRVDCIRIREVVKSPDQIEAELQDLQGQGDPDIPF